jgi:hypothetical protein
VRPEARAAMRDFVASPPAKRALSTALFWALSGLARLAPAESASELSARLVCPQRPGPGRVVCEAELEVEAGVLAWADVLVVDAPPFASPLRSRVGPSALFMKSDRRQRLQLALAATAAGSGELRVRARAVLCTDSELRSCRPATRPSRGGAEQRMIGSPHALPVVL